MLKNQKKKSFTLLAILNPIKPYNILHIRVLLFLSSHHLISIILTYVGKISLFSGNRSENCR